MQKKRAGSHINIKKLAQELNLSISTVSKALNDSHEISAKTKARVMELVQQLNYAPNPYASSLRSKKSKTIAVVIPDVADSFFSQAIKGVEFVAQTKGYHVLIYLTFESFEKEHALLKDIVSGRVDGVLVSVASETSDFSHFEAVKNKDIPIVFFDRAADIHTPKVVTNDFESSYEATSHLIKTGCKNIIYLSVSQSPFFLINNNRIRGYRQALMDNNFSYDESGIISCGSEPLDNYVFLKKFLNQPEMPDGIIMSVEKLILPFYQACHDLQIDISSSLKIACFSNLPTAPILFPPLTVIEQPAYAMGKAAADILFKALEKRTFELNDETIVIPSRLVVRESVEKRRSSNTAR